MEPANYRYLAWTGCPGAFTGRRTCLGSPPGFETFEQRRPRDFGSEGLFDVGPDHTRGSFSGRFQDRAQPLASFDRVPASNRNEIDGAGTGRVQLVFHLHGFDDQHGRADSHQLALLDQNLDHPPRHGCHERAIAGPTRVAAECATKMYGPRPLKLDSHRLATYEGSQARCRARAMADLLDVHRMLSIVRAISRLRAHLVLPAGCAWFEDADQAVHRDHRGERAWRVHNHNVVDKVADANLVVLGGRHPGSLIDA